MTIVCATNVAATQVIRVFIRHSLRPGHGYVKSGPATPDRHVYLTINVPLPKETWGQILRAIAAIAGTSIRQPLHAEAPALAGCAEKDAA